MVLTTGQRILYLNSHEKKSDQKDTRKCENNVGY